MSVQVIELADAAEARERGASFLAARPFEHNLLQTILAQSIEHSLGGTFWLVVDGPDVLGFALESPPGMGAVLAPMPPTACHLLAEAVTIPLWRAVGDAATAAAFAGRYTECTSRAVSEIHGQRLYKLERVTSAVTTPGSLRLAGSADRDTVIGWARAFVDELRLVPAVSEAAVDQLIARGQLRVWDHDGAVSMASASLPAAGVARVQNVFTPPELRGAGYATACVEHLSRGLVAQGLRCVLYTDLANPTSNAIYRRIGYEAVAEILGYQFA
jgi:ribosomal protein S18 acetylase RimI-like enzyme